ncbi:hypothetical protein ACFYTQ_33385 [Nocardia sp. NPDC004068]|uniref:hypothetical protein n=1 Tax=Nocardia sp. NPDC004068 TaxID=3364303 RepID=UPI00369EC377
MRRSIREFASELGIDTTTISNWRSGLGSVVPRPRMQAVLDTTLEQRATPDDRARFEEIVGEGEVVWRERHSGTARSKSLALDASSDGHLVAPAITETLDGITDAVTSAGEPSKHVDQGISTDLVDVLSRVHRLSRSVNPDVIQQLRSSTRTSIARYETIDPSGLVPGLKKQRRWLDDLLGECSHPVQRRQLSETASETSGLLGYIAVGSGHFSLARAYCLESFELADHAQDANLMAWARCMQSFCEYYAGQYKKALHYAEDGLAHAGAGPQSVRLSINGVARAAGKLGDTERVHRAVDQAYDLMSQHDVPEGVPSSITLGSYSPAQVAGNAATSYLSLAMPKRVEEYVKLALPEMKETNSPWGRSLVPCQEAFGR